MLKTLLSYKRITVLITIMLSSMLFSCASSKKASDSARLLGAYTKKINEDSRDFADKRTLMHKSRTMGINSTEDATFRIEMKTDETVSFWAFSKKGKEQTQLYNHIKKMTDNAFQKHQEQIKLAKNHQEDVKKIKSGVEISHKILDKTAKALATLGEEKKLEDQLSFYVTFFKDVQKTISELEEEGKQEVEKGEDKLEEKTEDRINKSKAEIDNI